MADNIVEDNVYDDLAEIQMRDRGSNNSHEGAQVPLEASSSPPLLMPKKGSSFRQVSSLLDRQHTSAPPKPVPRLRKQSFDQVTDDDNAIQSISSKLSSQSFSKSCDFDFPTIVTPQTKNSVRTSSSASSLQQLPVEQTLDKSAGSVGRSESLSRPVPLPRTRTVYKKQNVDNTIKEETTLAASAKISDTRDTTFDTPQGETSNSTGLSLQSKLDQVERLLNNDFDVFSNTSEQTIDIGKSEQDPPKQFVDSDPDEGKENDQNVYENYDMAENAQFSMPPVLPQAPKVPPRPNKSATPFYSKAEEETKVVESESPWGTDFDSVDNSSSQNWQADFSDFGAFPNPKANLSNDPWPVSSSISSSTSLADSGPPTDVFVTNTLPQSFNNQDHSSQVPFEDPFGFSSQKSVAPPSASYIDLEDFDPLLSGPKPNVDTGFDSSNIPGEEKEREISQDHSTEPLQDPFQMSKPQANVLDTFMASDSIDPINNTGDVYSLAKTRTTPAVPPKPSKLLSHAPSFHYSPPTVPPPPLPVTEGLPISEPKPPPVPPRPLAIGIASATAEPPYPAPRGASFLENLPTPVFSPMEDHSDPFSGTDFGEECYAFNKTLRQNGNSITQASAFSSTPSPVAAASSSVELSGVGSQEPSGASAAQDPCQDPERISRFVIPPPGAASRGNISPLHDPSGIYDLAEEISSSDSEAGDVPPIVVMDRPRWTSGGQPVAGLAILDSGQLSPKKNQRYGYLYKQGGYNANKGWKKRWVVFNGTSLSYYDNNTAQVSKRIIPVSCMKEVLNDVKSNDKHSFKFKVVTTLQDRVFIFSAESLEDCVLWANSIMAAITEFKKAKMDANSIPTQEKSDKEGFIKFSNMKKYYVIITGHHLKYFRSFKDFQMGSPIHDIDMKLASVKVKDRKRCRLQLWLNYSHFDLSFENDSDMQSWRMAMEDAIAEGLADDTVLEKVYHNLSNKECADCGAENPHWASINLGIVVCKNCAGIHRMFDYHVSKIRSLRMDTRVWTPSLIELMITIGNANANAFWEHSLPQDMKLPSSCSVQERKTFIHKKYLNRKFCNHHPLTGMAQALGEELHNVTSTDNVLEAMRVLFSGADVLFRKDGSDDTAYDIAKEAGQRLIMELLYQNCGDPQAVVEEEEDENRIREDIRLQGYLSKTGPGGKTFDKRWCILEHGALNYYLNEKSLTSRGSVDRKNMLLIQEVTLDRPGFHFEISTNSKENRLYAFSSDSRDDAGEWMRTLAKLIAPVAVMEHVGMIDIKFSGYVHLRESIGNEWKQSFLVFTWRGLYYMNKDLRFDYIDLRKASSIKLQDADSGYQSSVEKGPCFIICCTGKSLYLQAPLARDTEKMFYALLEALRGSGSTLIDQALTNENVPVIVDKCITHIAKLGLEEKGIYRLSAQTSRVQSLLDEFRKDAGSVVLESYTVHEVANVLKRFLRELEDSVFERINYPQWTGMAASKDVNSRLMWYKYYLEKMPTVNHSTLKRIILHLSQVAIYETSNQMNMFNLATCFAPSLLRTEMDMPNLMSDISSREINIIVDLISYQDYFFQDKENERKINDNIRRAEQQIMQKMQENKESVSSSSIEKILTPVHMMTADGPAVNILVTEDTTAQAALDYFKRSKATSDIDTSSFALYEFIFKGVLVRPLFPEESMAPTVKRWLEWEDWVKEDNSVSLCARNTELLEKLDANHNATHILLSKLQYCDSKSKRFKRYTVGFRQCRLAVYTNPKAVIEVASWNVEDLAFYIGVVPKKSPPTKYCLTFVVNGEKCSKTVGLFGHCLCFDTEDELYRWAAALFIAQHPNGFLTWNS